MSIVTNWPHVLQLWSLIALSNGSSFHFSALCLGRSGATTPLDIEIYLSNRFWTSQAHPAPEVRENAMLDALNFIVAHGGSTPRWRSFWLYTPADVRSIDPQVVALNFIGKHPLPALERFEIKYDGPHWSTIEKSLAKTLQNKILFSDPPPNRLQVAALEWVPNSSLFDSPVRPPLVGLTQLEIKLPRILPELEHINALLAASPLLRVLSISTRLYYHSPPPILERRTELARLPKINLPKLQALALLFTTRSSIAWWEHSLLLMIDAPNVKSLRFMVEGPGIFVPYNRDIVDHLIKGPDSCNPSPLFPSLTGLELFILRGEGLPSPYCDEFDHEILAAYPSVTTLVLPSGVSHRALNVKPWLVPCLDRLLIHVDSASELEEAIDERCRAGVGPKTVEVPELSCANIESEEPELPERFKQLGVEVQFSYSENRVREALGFEES